MRARLSLQPSDGGEAGHHTLNSKETLTITVLCLFFCVAYCTFTVFIQEPGACVTLPGKSVPEIHGWNGIV